MAARTNAWVDMNNGFESRREHGRLSLVNVVCYQVEASASGCSLVQRKPTECGVSDCDRDVSVLRGPSLLGQEEQKLKKNRFFENIIRLRREKVRFSN